MKVTFINNLGGQQTNIHVTKIETLEDGRIAWDMTVNRNIVPKDRVLKIEMM